MNEAEEITRLHSQLAAARAEAAALRERCEERKEGNLIFLSQLRSALNRVQLENNNEGVMTRLTRTIDRLIAAEAEAARYRAALEEIASCDCQIPGIYAECRCIRCHAARALEGEVKHE